MSLTIISGKIQSQPLNDNFSYLNERKNDIAINVKDFGAVGDGVTDDTNAFQAAVDSLDNNGIIFVPTSSSEYILNSTVLNNGKYPLFIINNGAEVDITKIESIAIRYDEYGIKIEGNNQRISSGALGPGGGGVLLGGAEITGSNGMWLSMDANPSWMTIGTSKVGNPTELTIQPASNNGYVDTNGTTVTWVSGEKFDTTWEGIRIYINNTLYSISSIDSDEQITLTSSAGTQNNVAYQRVSTKYDSTVDTTSATVTWVSGEKFPYWWSGYQITINSSNYTVSAVATDGESLTLTTTSIGTLSNVSLFYEDSNNIDCAALGINKKSGGDEERLVLVAKATGEYRIATVATGSGQHYPVYIDTGGKTAIEIDTSQNFSVLNEQNAQLGIKSSAGKNYYFISKNTNEFVLFTDTLNEIYTVDGTAGRINYQYPPVLPSYTVATLPSSVAGAMCFVTDETGGAVVAFHDGTNWRRVTDRVVVS